MRLGVSFGPFVAVTDEMHTRPRSPFMRWFWWTAVWGMGGFLLGHWLGHEWIGFWVTVVLVNVLAVLSAGVKVTR